MKRTSQVITRRFRTGFTLIEMMVSASMTVAIVVAMTSYFGIIARVSADKRGSQTLATGMNAVREQILDDVRSASAVKAVRYDTHKRGGMDTSGPYTSYYYSTILYVQVPSYDTTGSATNGDTIYAYCMAPSTAYAAKGRVIRAVLPSSAIMPTDSIKYMDTTDGKYPCGTDPLTGTYLTDETTQAEHFDALEIVDSAKNIIGIRMSLSATYDLRVHDATLPAADTRQSPPRITITGIALKK